jgi:hypothetical protein
VKYLFVNKSYNFGSPIKYSQFGKIKKNNFVEINNLSAIDHAYKVYDDSYQFVTKKYKLVKKRKLYTYLYLSEQENNLDNNESGL